MAKGGACVLFLYGLLLIACTMQSCSAKEVADQESKMGMEVLYEMVHFFLGDIVQTKNISESFLNLSTIFVNNEFNTDKLNDWKEWADYGKGYAAGAAIGILFIVVMPLVGLFFCCCRVCGKCGGKPRIHDSRRSKCKRRTYCTLIVVFNTLALAGVVCSFMCSHLIHKALKNENNEGTIGHIQESLTSINNFTNGAVNNVSNTVLSTFEEVSDTAISHINRTGFEAVDTVLSHLNATQHLQTAKSISGNVKETKEQLQEIGMQLGNLTQETKQLQMNLTSIRENIQNVCGQSCNSFNPDDYNTKANFSSLDTLKEEADKVSKSMDMAEYVEEAEAQITKAKTNATANIQDVLDTARNSIHNVKGKVEESLRKLKKQKDDAMSFLPSTQKDLNDIDEDIKDNYSDYVFYGCVAVSCVYLLIVVLYYLGVVFGLCGERPGHDAPCCNRGTGANFLMAGVGFTFIFSWILMLVCTILFVLGGISYTEVCRYFHGHDPSNFKVFDTTLTNGLDLSETIFNDTGVKFSISQSIRDCQENKAMYSAFLLDKIVDLNTAINIEPLKKELEKLGSSNLKIDNITIISPQLQKELKDFAEAGIQNINFTQYFHELNERLTHKDLGELYEAVLALADSQTDEDKTKLTAEAARLQYLKDNTIVDMSTRVRSLKSTMLQLEKGSSVTSAIQTLIDDLKQSEEDFNVNKNVLLKQKIEEVGNKTLNETDLAVDNLIKKISTDTARCKPLSDSLYSISDSVCVLIVDPVNGLWFSFGWCLFFFILCLIFGVLLAGEYRHEYKYGKEFDEPFDGRNHDMMPLTRYPNTNPVILQYFKQSGVGSQVHLVPADSDRSGYMGEPIRGERHHHQQQQHYLPPHHNHHYQTPDGVHNSGFSPDMKHRPHHQQQRHESSIPPPPYGQHTQPGIAAYAASPPPDYNGHQHHDLASAYPALSNRGGHSYLADGGSKNSYSYPY